MKPMTEAALTTQRRRGIGGPVGFRRFLERRGPTFVKIGQFLALRPDLIPREFSEELMRLFERVPAFPWPEARRIIREDLDGEPAELFGYFDPNPVAAGSLAQIYFARLDDGAEVAVKILRPGARARIARDLRHARRLARLLTMSGSSFILSPQEVLEEIAGWLTQELDLQRELSNIGRFRRLASQSRFQVAPRPYPRLSSARILTMEYVRGVHVIDLLAARDPHGRPAAARAEAVNIDRDRLAKRLIQSCLTQIFQYRFFHADLHPGNLIALPGGRIAFIDFGLCQALDDTVRKRQMHYLSALYRGDNDQVFRYLQEIIIPTPEADPEGLRRDFFAAVRDWAVEKDDDADHRAGGGAYSSAVANYMISVMRAAHRNGYKMPIGILAMYRALLTAETVANLLGSKTDLRRVGRTFIEELRSREALRALEIENLGPVLSSYVSLWREYPNQVSQILTDLADSRFVLKVNMSENADLRQIRNRRARAVVTSIAAVSVAVLIAFSGTAEGSPVWLRPMLIGLLLLLYLVTYLDYRRLK